MLIQNNSTSLTFTLNRRTYHTTAFLCRFFAIFEKKNIYIREMIRTQQSVVILLVIPIHDKMRLNCLQILIIIGMMWNIIY